MFADMAKLTVTSPAEAARMILSRGYQGEVAWTALLLATVLNAMQYALQGLLVPLPPGSGIPQFSTGAYLVLALVLQVVLVGGLYLAGRWLGGRARGFDLMILLSWLQIVLVAAQAALSLMFLVAPFIAALGNLIVSITGIYILVNFINEAHGLGSLWRALGVLLMAAIAIALSLSFLLALIGPAFLGISANV
jgi:hypothetical protein